MGSIAYFHARSCIGGGLPPFREKAGLVRIDFTPEGKIIPHAGQPFAL